MCFNFFEMCVWLYLKYYSKVMNNIRVAFLSHYLAISVSTRVIYFYHDQLHNISLHKENYEASSIHNQITSEMSLKIH